MEGVVDIIRMELLTNASKKQRDKWKYLILLAILSNYKKFFSQLQQYVYLMCMKLGMLRKCITPAPPKEKPPKAIVKLKFSKNDCNNKIFKELLTRHSKEFDIVQLREPNQWHVVQPKTIELKEDIFFRLDFQDQQVIPQKADKNKKNSDVDDDKQDELQQQQKEAAMKILQNEYELSDSRGQVFSYTLSLEELLDFLHTNYVPPEPKYVAPVELPKKIQLFTMSVGRATKFDFKTDNIHGEWLEFTISKSLDNIFLEPDVRERLMSQIDRFNDPIWYAERGLPRTLGILLYGSPGCGKTSFIKAVSAYMKRRVLIVDFKLVTTVAQLRKIFSGIMYDETREDLSYRFTKENTVYVFEDFDCMSDVFMDRKLKDAKEQEKEDASKEEKASVKKSNTLLEDMLMFKRMEMMEKREEKLKRKKKKLAKKKKQTDKDGDKDENKKSDSDSSDSDIGMKRSGGGDTELLDEEFEYAGLGGLGGVSHYPKAKWGNSHRLKEKVTLADFLELLDGIVEMDGRIIIMTTNQREKMDSALVRPGRIDLDLELKPPSRLLIAHIFKHMYKHVEEDVLKALFFKYYEHLPESIVSTARVINCFMFTNPENGIRSLMESAQSIMAAEGTLIHKDSLEISNIADDVDIPSCWTPTTIWEDVLTTEVRKTEKCASLINNGTDLWQIFKNELVYLYMSSESENSIRKCILDIEQKDYKFVTDPHRYTDQFILFEFLAHEVNLTEYAIKVRAQASYRLHNWNLEGSNDNSSWDTLISHINDPTFIDRKETIAKFTLPTTTKSYRWIRLKSTGLTYFNDGLQKSLSNTRVIDVLAIQMFGTAKKI